MTHAPRSTRERQKFPQQFFETFFTHYIMRAKQQVTNGALKNRCTGGYVVIVFNDWLLEFKRIAPIMDK